MKTKLSQNVKGITLIALVITIIVLLILAGVAISMLSGENGILRQVSNAKQYTDGESEFEGVKLAATASLINEKHMIEDETKLQEQLDNHFDNALAEGNATSGYIVTIGSNVYNVSSTGEVIKAEPEILQSDIWSLSKVVLVSSDENKVNPAGLIKVKSKYKTTSLQEYKESIILKEYIKENEVFAGCEDLDDVAIMGLQRVFGIEIYTMEDLILMYEQLLSQDVTRDQIVYSFTIGKGDTADATLQAMGYDIEEIEQEYESIEQPEEIPDEIKNITYTITYPNGISEEVDGESLASFVGRSGMSGNGSNKVKINNGQKELILKINISKHCPFVYEDEYYKYYWYTDVGYGYRVEVKDKTLETYGEILTEIEGAPVATMIYTFADCANLITAPEIPESITYMESTFSGCTKLSGILRINSTNLYYGSGVLENAATEGTGLKVLVPNESMKQKLSSYANDKITIEVSK